MVFTTMFTRKMKMYDQTKLHIGIDTLKFRLSPIFQDKFNKEDIQELLDYLKDNIRHALNHDETPRVYYDPDQRAWLVFNKIDGYVTKQAICRFYHLGKTYMYVELFGMFQAYDGSFLNLNDTHSTILNLLSDLHRCFNLSIIKIDLSIDWFYDFKKSFVYFHKESAENDINKVKKQHDHDISYAGRFPMHTIDIPIKDRRLLKERIIRFVEKNKRKIKLKKVGEKRPEGSYYRFGTFESSHQIYQSFSECEEDHSSHIQLKIADKNLFFEVKKLLKKEEMWTYDFDGIEDIKMSKSTQKSSSITYDKTRRDLVTGNDDDSEEQTYENVRMEYANNDEDLAADLSVDWRHTRFELRVSNPGVSSGKQPLDPTDENSYEKIFSAFLKKIKYVTIVLIKPKVPNGVYINYCRKAQMGKDKLKQIKPTKAHGKTLKPIDFIDSVSDKLDMIKSFFVR